jgi:vancomycin resistance protein YoaR
METGLPVTERLNHAFVVDHYVWPNWAPGWEATIFEPSPDLKFVNDTDAYILIHTYRQADDKVVFEFYGTDPHRTSEIAPPYWHYGGPASGGKTTFTYNVTDDETGEELQNVEFVSIFQPLSKFKLTR